MFKLLFVAATVAAKTGVISVSETPETAAEADPVVIEETAKAEDAEDVPHEAPVQEAAAETAEPETVAELVVFETLAAELKPGETPAQAEPEKMPGLALHKTRATDTLAKDLSRTLELKNAGEKITAGVDKHVLTLIENAEAFTLLEDGEARLEDGECAAYINLTHFYDKRENRQVDGKRRNLRVLQLFGDVKVVAGPKERVLAETDIQISVDGDPAQQTATMDMLLPVLTRAFAARASEIILDAEPNR
ncbi:MAG: hypothetical protein FWF96_03595 [Kiritimatiellaeota bacterium]|nr:hypothetical protein [Kiritimatiellota bacterium]